MEASSSASSGFAEAARRVPGDVRAENVRIGRLRVHVATAPSSPLGILMYPTIMGLDEPMRRFARAFAEAGFTAVVWDPYDGEDGTGSIPEMLAGPSGARTGR